MSQHHQSGGRENLGARISAVETDLSKYWPPPHRALTSSSRVPLQGPTAAFPPPRRGADTLLSSHVVRGGGGGAAHTLPLPAHLRLGSLHDRSLPHTGPRWPGRLALGARAPRSARRGRRRPRRRHRQQQRQRQQRRGRGRGATMAGRRRRRVRGVAQVERSSARRQKRHLQHGVGRADPPRARRRAPGRGLYSLPCPLNLSLFRPFPLNFRLCPPYDPTEPVDVTRRCPC